MISQNVLWISLEHTVYAFLYGLLKKVWIISEVFSKVNEKIIEAFSIKKVQGNTVKEKYPPKERITNLICDILKVIKNYNQKFSYRYKQQFELR